MQNDQNHRFTDCALDFQLRVPVLLQERLDVCKRLNLYQRLFRGLCEAFQALTQWSFSGSKLYKPSHCLNRSDYQLFPKPPGTSFLIPTSLAMVDELPFTMCSPSQTIPRRQRRRHMWTKQQVVSVLLPDRWSLTLLLEQDAILLESRRMRKPYEQIGKKLGRSVLACRLHYHHLVGRKSQELDLVRDTRTSSNNPVSLFHAQEVSNSYSETNGLISDLTRPAFRTSEYWDNGPSQQPWDRRRLRGRDPSCTYTTRPFKFDVERWLASKSQQRGLKPKEGPVIQHPRPPRVLSKNTGEHLTRASTCENTDASKTSISFLLNQ